jgi:phytoene dehydrogenase-like protein
VNPDNKVNKLWKEVGALEGVQIVNYDVFVTIEDDSGNVLNVDSDIDRFEKHLLEISPQDKELICELTRAARKSVGFNPPIHKPQELYGFLDALKSFFHVAPYMKDISKYGKITIKEFAQSFKSPFLKEAFSHILPEGSSASGLIATLGQLHSKKVGYPIGGSLEFSKSIESKYKSLGGKVSYNSKVERVIVYGNKSIGVKLANGDEHFADIIVSSTDGHAAIYDMLEGKYTEPSISEFYTNSSKYQTFTSLQVSLGINCVLSDKPHFVKIILDKPVSIDGFILKYVPIKHYCYDNTICPEGKSVITSLIDTSFEYWESLYKTPEKYLLQKQRIADEVIAAIEKRYPEIKDKIEVIDVATPMTYTHYANAWKGAYMSWLVTPETGIFKVPKKLSGLSNFFMTGQWTNPPGGLSSALLAGRNIVQIICNKDKKKFKHII